MKPVLGFALPVAFINQFKSKFPDSLIVVDAVSSLPYPQFDYTKIDSVFFSVQKGFGLPAGLGVWVVNDQMHREGRITFSSKGISIGTYHNLPTLAYPMAKKIKLRKHLTCISDLFTWKSRSGFTSKRYSNYPQRNGVYKALYFIRLFQIIR
jgi:aspartate aminotransferase-like enzyme